MGQFTEKPLGPGRKKLFDKFNSVDNPDIPVRPHLIKSKSMIELDTADLVKTKPFLLQENGAAILQENGFEMVIEDARRT